jgi:hypothetical protein
MLTIIISLTISAVLIGSEVIFIGLFVAGNRKRLASSLPFLTMTTALVLVPVLLLARLFNTHLPPVFEGLTWWFVLTTWWFVISAMLHTVQTYRAKRPRPLTDRELWNAFEALTYANLDRYRGNTEAAFDDFAAKYGDAALSRLLDAILEAGKAIPRPRPDEEIH